MANYALNTRPRLRQMKKHTPVLTVILSIFLFAANGGLRADVLGMIGGGNIGSSFKKEILTSKPSRRSLTRAKSPPSTSIATGTSNTSR